MSIAENVARIKAQMAEAAIAAGIETLTESAGTSCDDITTLYIAGGFGSHLNVASAAAIGRTLVASGRFKLSDPGMKRVLYATGVLPETHKNA